MKLKIAIYTDYSVYIVTLAIEFFFAKNVNYYVNVVSMHFIFKTNGKMVLKKNSALDMFLACS